MDGEFSARRPGMGRRKFLGCATMGALAVPAVLQGGLNTCQAANKSSKDVPKEVKTKMKRICIEEHWANKEMLGWRAEWMKRTGMC
jgi:hypothetical protein